jgi:hypothetical protein
MNQTLLPHQTIDYALTRAVEYYGYRWFEKVTIIFTADGYKLLMKQPAK